MLRQRVTTCWREVADSRVVMHQGHQYVSPKSLSFLPAAVPGLDAPTPVLIRLPPGTPLLCRLVLGVGMAVPGTGMPLKTPSSSSLEYVPRRLGVRNSPSFSSSMSIRLMLRACPVKDPPIDDLGLPRGVRVPESDDREAGRSIRDEGLACDDTLARELGRERLASDSGPLLGSGPKDSRLAPDVLSRGT